MASMGSAGEGGPNDARAKLHTEGLTLPHQQDQAAGVANEGTFEEHLIVIKRKMPKRKHKFGKGAKRGGDRKSCWEVDATALVDPTALVARERPTTTAVPVKRMNKNQLHRSLHSTMKKLICAKKKATTTAKKLSGETSVVVTE